MSLLLCPRCGAQYDDLDTRFCTQDGTPLVDPDIHTFIGRHLDERYEILELIGQGRLAATYKGRHVKLNKQVAIKVLSAKRAAQDQNTQRFLREAKTAGRVSHPNVMDVNDFGQTADGVVYLVLEYLQGISLKTLLERQERLHVFDAVNILRQLTAGLAAIHQQGIVHLGLNPENIYVREQQGKRRVVRMIQEGHKRRFVVEPEGTWFFVKLGGFEGARFVEGQERSQDAAQPIIATLPHSFMSLEQSIGTPVDRRSDIYSLGLLFYRMISGKLPFDGPPQEGVTTIPPDWRMPELMLSEGTNHTIMRCLENSPEDRFQTIGELQKALDDCHADKVWLRDAARLPGAVEAGIAVPQKKKETIRVEAAAPAAGQAESPQEPLLDRRPSLTDELRTLFTNADQNRPAPKKK